MSIAIISVFGQKIQLGFWLFTEFCNVGACKSSKIKERTNFLTLGKQQE